MPDQCLTMKQIPPNNLLPTNKLAACFNKTSATYKFYWLLAIIQYVESGKCLITKRELFSAMISIAWYTVNYFHVSFGKQDKLQRAIEKIKELENLTIDAKKDDILEKLIQTTNKFTLKELYYFDNQVPHWFLSPWFPGKNRNEIYKQSHQFNNYCPYSIDKDYINVNLLWANYFVENAGVIKDFCWWNLAMYLQTKNPSVPDIPNKLIKPALRSSLFKQKAQFWDIVLEELGSINCIYTNNLLQMGNYAMEHFVPFNFVSHDLIWNLIPADRAFNSSKGDKLPQINKYFDRFYDLQESAINIVSSKQPKNKYLEEYLTIFPDMEITKIRYRETLQPLITIAANNGFEYL